MLSGWPGDTYHTANSGQSGITVGRIVNTSGNRMRRRPVTLRITAHGTVDTVATPADATTHATSW